MTTMILMGLEVKKIQLQTPTLMNQYDYNATVQRNTIQHTKLRDLHKIPLSNQNKLYSVTFPEL